MLKRISEAEAKHNHALQQALMKAQQANYARQLFLNNLSHDIRTPLNIILGLGEINQKTADPEILRENQSKIRVAEEHLLAIMNNTLEMTQLEKAAKAAAPVTLTGRNILVVEDEVVPHEA